MWNRLLPIQIFQHEHLYSMHKTGKNADTTYYIALLPKYINNPNERYEDNLI